MHTTLAVWLAGGALIFLAFTVPYFWKYPNRRVGTVGPVLAFSIGAGITWPLITLFAALACITYHLKRPRPHHGARSQ